MRDLSGEPRSLTLPYEDEIRSVEGPDVRGAGAGRTTRVRKRKDLEPATYSSPSFLMSSAKRGSPLSESALGSARK